MLYGNFYHFKREPFSLSPDPRFMYMALTHSEALAQLRHAMESRRGFAVLSGEVGTGKTTVLRSLLEGADAKFLTAYVLNPPRTRGELYGALASELSIQLEGAADTWFLKMHRFLLDAHTRGQIVVAMFDEAQNIPVDVLEEIRLLTNIETSTTKLLQVILVGQPELDKLLDSHELRALRQRIALRHALTPLSLQESRKYIRSRLGAAGGDPHLFDDAACHEVYRYSHGVPRVTNLLCENCLIAGYASEQKIIDWKLVRSTAAEMQLVQPYDDSAIEIDAEDSIAAAKPEPAPENPLPGRPRVPLKKGPSEPAVRTSSRLYSVTPRVDAGITAKETPGATPAPAVPLTKDPPAPVPIAMLAKSAPDPNADSAVNSSLAPIGSARSSALPEERTQDISLSVFGSGAAHDLAIDRDGEPIAKGSFLDLVSSIESQAHSDAAPLVRCMSQHDAGAAPEIVSKGPGPATPRTGTTTDKNESGIPGSGAPVPSSQLYLIGAGPDRRPSSRRAGIVIIFASLVTISTVLILLSQESLGAATVSSLLQYVRGIL